LGEQDRNTNTKNVASLATFLYLDEGSKAKQENEVISAVSCLEDEDEGGVKHEK